ncbi:ISAzo13 family transposase, partial [Specibacter cremeus]|uniref:ISAzo13 family transposase n=1 Tax=Specibacter cremeus TaxID=1629051 RepID=UPI000F78EFC3
MPISAEIVEVLRAKFDTILPHLDERATRLLLGAEARSLGHGGIAAVARASGAARSRVQQGVNELEAGIAPLEGVRKPGAGRKTLVEKDPGLVPALLAIVEPTRRGDPESPLSWTTLSTAKLAAELTEQGHRVGAETVAKLLKGNGFSLQANTKTLEGTQHPDRNEQFGYINAQATDHLDAGDPVVSIDAKKKELVGAYKNKGAEWRPAGDPERVRVHDFIDKELGKANPYGVYDVGTNTGWVSVGTDHDTAAFAVNTIRSWWNTAGNVTHPGASRLLVTADGGGSNGYRTRLFKTELAALATETGLEITVCHLPPGTSKWNKIEHKLFSHISMNWRGRPLTSHEVIVNSIAATTTTTGLRVHAELDTNVYPTGVKIPDKDMAELASSGTLTRHKWHPEWNYTC